MISEKLKQEIKASVVGVVAILAVFFVLGRIAKNTAEVAGQAMGKAVEAKAKAEIDAAVKAKVDAMIAAEIAARQQK